jgi:2-haloalkanoic acid dehalogenase type II
MEYSDNKQKHRLPVEAVIFDLGATLIYFDGDWEQIVTLASQELHRSLVSSGLDLEADAFMADFRARMVEYYEEREAEFIEYTTAYILQKLLEERGLVEIEEAVIRTALKAMYTVSQQYWKVEDDAVPMLEELKSKGYLLAIISNAGDDEDVQTLIDNAGIRSYFDFIISSAAAGIRKPNPEIFHTVLSALNVAPSRAVMVGDRLGADILGAHNAGMPAILISRRADTAANRAHAETILPEATIETLSELPGVLEEFIIS